MTTVDQQSNMSSLTETTHVKTGGKRKVSTKPKKVLDIKLLCEKSISKPAAKRILADIPYMKDRKFRISKSFVKILGEAIGTIYLPRFVKTLAMLRKVRGGTSFYFKDIVDTAELEFPNDKTFSKDLTKLQMELLKEPKKKKVVKPRGEKKKD